MKSKFGIALILSLLAWRSEGRAQEGAGPGPLAAGIDERIPLPQTESEVRVQLGKSLLITSQEPLQRVSVTDPTIASAVAVSPTQILIHGLKAGAGTLILW